MQIKEKLVASVKRLRALQSCPRYQQRGFHSTFMCSQLISFNLANKNTTKRINFRLFFPLHPLIKETRPLHRRVSSCPKECGNSFTRWHFEPRPRIPQCSLVHARRVSRLCSRHQDLRPRVKRSGEPETAFRAGLHQRDAPATQRLGRRHLWRMW